MLALRWHPFQGAQGLPKKIEFELLTADHPLQLGDAKLGCRQGATALSGDRAGNRLQAPPSGLGPALAVQALESEGLEGPEPIMQRLARHAQIPRHRRNAFTALHALDGLQFERRQVLAALRLATSLQHRSSSSDSL